MEVLANGVRVGCPAKRKFRERIAFVADETSGTPTDVVEERLTVGLAVCLRNIEARDTPDVVDTAAICLSPNVYAGTILLPPAAFDERIVRLMLVPSYVVGEGVGADVVARFAK